MQKDGSILPCIFFLYCFNTCVTKHWNVYQFYSFKCMINNKQKLQQQNFKYNKKYGFCFAMLLNIQVFARQNCLLPL